MKLLTTLLLISCILFASCSKDELFENHRADNYVKINYTRSYNDAMAIAQRAADYVDNIEDNTLSRRKIQSRTNNRIICSSKVKTSKNNQDTLLYIFNYENDKGFAVVSANKNTEDLLAIVEEGHYSDKNTENDESGFKLFMELSEKYVSKNKIPNRLEPIPFYESDTLHEKVFNLINVKWGQRHPEGDYCPNGISGCVITAVAQIMSYYQYPDSIELTYPNADIDTQYLDWTDIRKHILYYPVNGSESPIYCSASDSAHNAIGRLCRQLGHVFGSTYYTNSTGTVSANIRQDLIDLGYNCNTLTNYTSGTSKIHLNNNKPLYFSGRTSDDEGHAWIVDGYEALTIHSTYIDGITENIYRLYNHVINWGWNGRNNGYFLDNVFDTTNYSSLDSGPYPPTAGYDFNYNIRYYVPYI